MASLHPAEREVIENEIERLIDMLDTIDPDPELEPSLGYNPYCGNPATVDLEGDSSDDEPSLGWLDQEAKWGRYAEYSAADLELDESDDEPSLGAPNVSVPAPTYRLGGGHGHCLFPRYREPGILTYSYGPGVSQLMWGEGARADLEEEHDGAEPC